MGKSAHQKQNCDWAGNVQVYVPKRGYTKKALLRRETKTIYIGIVYYIKNTSANGETINCKYVTKYGTNANPIT